MRDWLVLPVLAFLTCSTFVPLARAADAPNACGCFRDDKGSCRCMKPTKCGCPGECEPAGCEAKRQAAAEREAQAALKRIAERERKAAAAAKKQGKRGKTDAKPPKPADAPARSEVDDALEGKQK